MPDGSMRFPDDPAATTRPLAGRAGGGRGLPARDVASSSAPPGYELLRPLGRGGCGEVHLARDTRLDRLVAIKFLLDATRADLERFRREARVTARLDNPSIVRIHELGDVDGRPFIAMQYVEGGNLASAALDATSVARAAREIAGALACAHEQGIVHRDLKPENVLLDRRGRAVVTDFGIARDLAADRDGTISREGQIVGTPALMPPEQARGEIQAVDSRSDVYGLGATLYRTLTGHAPFEGRTIVDVLHAVIHDDPPLPRSRNASIPRSLEAIVVTCMAKRREDRYQAMGEVIAVLDRFLAEGAAGSTSAPWFRHLVGTLLAGSRPLSPGAPARRAR
jgi:serine/threonine-protein kinase